MDEKRRARREALRKLARKDRNVEKEGFTPVKPMEGKDEYFEKLSAKRKARAEKAMKRHENGQHLKEASEVIKRSSEVAADLDRKNKAREAAKKKERLKGYGRFLASEYEK